MPPPSHQIIDDNGQFTTALNTFLDNLDNSVSSKYSILAVLGAQSSGKSTLLNHVFNTNFPVLNSSHGRHQTTRGLWIAQPPSAPNVFVVDSEGTDGKERGEALIYERKFALFSLILADILIVNIWHQDIGRHGASNLSLLRSVFDAKARLFLSSGSLESKKKTIIFAVRDHIAHATTIEILGQQLIESVSLLWNEVAQRHELTHIRVDSLFDFDFFGFPNLFYQLSEFQTSVKSFKDILINKSSKIRPTVPLPGLNQWCENIWNLIEQDKDLNIPSQLELLAIFRGREILQELIEISEQKLSQLVVGDEYVANFSSSLSPLLLFIAQEFEKAVRYYDKAGIESVTTDLIHKIPTLLRSFILNNINRAVELQTNVFKSKLESLITSSNGLEPVFPKGFTTKSAKLQSQLLASFNTFVNESIPKMSSAFSNRLYDHFVDSLQSSLKSELDQIYKDFQKRAQTIISSIKEKIVSQLKDSTKSQVERLILSFEVSTNDLSLPWFDLYSFINKVVKHAMVEVNTVLDDMEMTKFSDQNLIELLAPSASQCLSTLANRITNQNQLVMIAKNVIQTALSGIHKNDSVINWVKSTTSGQNQGQNCVETIKNDISKFLKSMSVLPDPASLKFSDEILFNIYTRIGSNSELLSQITVDNILNSLEDDFKMALDIVQKRDSKFKRLLLTFGLMLFILFFLVMNRPKLLVVVLTMILVFKMWFAENGLAGIVSSRLFRALK
ncbi:hypothetical protein RCL1_002555 [Eukaryota sp. TZLM3-RCL]